MNFYNSLDFIESEEDISRVSNLKGKNAAMCVERAMLSQNLLKSLGINSVYKQSDIINNGKAEGHAYNIISYDNKYYIFDSTIPTLKDEIISPLITEIPDYVYEKIISSDANTGYSVIASHYNPLTDKDVNLVYDAGRKEKYFGEDIKENLTK